MNNYSPEERKILLDLVKKSIQYGLKNKKIMPINIDNYSPHLQEQRATFITLQIHGDLRGCIGSLQAHQPLVIDVVHNAYAAAFSDPRFLPVRPDEFDKLEIHISVLSKPEPMSFDSEQDLIRQIRPNIDGLILSDNGYRGTFLPSVWEQLPEPKLFFTHLKLKAGLSQNYWSKTLKVERYTTESIS